MVQVTGVPGEKLHNADKGRASDDLMMERSSGLAPGNFLRATTRQGGLLYREA
jgi:hypothetical protein